ncbi:MAG: alpha/beta fold hydrolase [Methanobacteriaceae archaeon]|nr:alpha/beta fold hydrolase [Methanobacteriaceae archaeon]
MYYQDLGEGYPLILVHGLASDHTVWEGLTPLLSRDYHVFAVNLRGHGQSSNTPGPYSIELFSEDIYRFLTSLGIEQAHFMGHSMGGAVLQELSLHFPEKFRSLTLISSFAHVDPPVQKVFLNLQKILTEEGFEAFFDSSLQLANSPQFLDRNQELFLKIRDEMAETISIDSLKNTIKACCQVNLIDSLKNVEIPTLVIAGAKDQFIPPNHSIRISERIPHSEIRIIPDASHNLLVESPMETYSILKNFLDSL